MSHLRLGLRIRANAFLSPILGCKVLRRSPDSRWPALRPALRVLRGESPPMIRLLLGAGDIVGGTSLLARW